VAVSHGAAVVADDKTLPREVFGQREHASVRSIGVHFKFLLEPTADVLQAQTLANTLPDPRPCGVQTVIELRFKMQEDGFMAVQFGVDDVRMSLKALL
jgi:hypothetical protein